MEIAALVLLCGVAIAQISPPYIPNINDHLTVNRLSTSDNPLPPTELRITDNVINLRRASSWSLSSVYVQALRRQAGGSRAVSAGRATVCALHLHHQ